MGLKLSNNLNTGWNLRKNHVKPGFSVAFLAYAKRRVLEHGILVIPITANVNEKG